MYDLLSLNIKSASRLLLDGSISAIKLTNLCLENAKKFQKFNAFITITETEATNQSEQSTIRFKNNNILSDLDGVTFAIKDNFCTSNIRTSCGSKMLDNFIPTYNATVYQRLIDAGAILIGKTNLDEFAMGSGTINSFYGPTTNIWQYNDENFYISGGSSGGSAIAVASGTCFAGIGSDTGGSTRIPASYCGIVGLKPTYGLISRWGLIPLVNSMDTPGILTRTVDDCVSVLNVIAGFDGKDSTSLTKPYRKIRLPPANRMIIKGLKVGIPREYYNNYLTDDVLNVWNDVALLLKSHGAQIKQVTLPHTELSMFSYSVLNQCEVASNMSRYDGMEFGFRKTDSLEDNMIMNSRSEAFNDEVKTRILAGNYFSLTKNFQKYYNQAMKVRRLVSEDFDRVWEDVQLLLTPTTLSTAPLYNDFIQKDHSNQDGIHDYCTQPVNLAGIPAVSIPIRLSSEGLPISIQIIGRSLSEPMMLALAKYIETVVQFPSFCIASSSLRINFTLISVFGSPLS